MKDQFIPLDKSQQGFKIAEFLPTGNAWDAKNDISTNLGAFLLALGVELNRIEELIQTTNRELDINFADELLSEWETSVGIPDDCFGTSEDDETRRKQIIVKLRNVRLQTAEDFENLALVFGKVVKVTSGADHGIFPLSFPFTFFSLGKKARFTIIVDSESNNSVFPLPFPLQFSTGVNGVIECIFTKLKPANCNILFRYGVTL